SHFLQYYLFLPIVGLALIVGAVLVWLYDVLRRLQPLVAGAAIALVLGGVLAATNRTIQGDIRDNQLLGGSSRAALNTLTDLKQFYPSLPAKTTLYFEDALEPLTWQHDSGGLIKMA